MKILFITNNFPPIVDGVGDYTYNIAKQFAEHNHEVYVVCKKNAEINTGIEEITVLPIIERWNFNCYKPIVKFIKEKMIEIVSLQYVPHGFHLKGLPFPLIKLTKEIKKCNCKLFTFCHEVYVEEEKRCIKRTVLSKLMQYVSKRIIDNSDYVATSIEYYRDMIIKLSPSKIYIPTIPIASNIPETNLSEVELVNLKKELTPNNETIISFFGLRNIQTSIDVVSELKNNGYKIKILLIGKTSKNLPDNLPKDTYKTGTLDIQEIDKYLKITDIFILPENNQSGCSLKSGSLAAAINNNLSIITSKGKLTSDKLLQNPNILFCDFNSSNEIREKIIYFTSIKKEYTNNKHYIIDWVQTYNIYNDIIKNNGYNLCYK